MAKDKELVEPKCAACKGMLKPDAVFFGEQLPWGELIESEKRSRSCDLCIVLGSSLVVYPAAMIPQYEAPFLGTVQRMFLERMNRYDHAVEHGQALSACGLAFDGAVNEAIEAGAVWLDSYPAVDWFTGEDSVADASLSEAERPSLAAYLDGGGRLLISGAEIGYDLVEYGRDSDFYREYLHAEYQGDDAGTYEFAGVPGSILDGLGGRRGAGDRRR